MANKNTALKNDDIHLIRECFFHEKMLTKKDLREMTGLSSGGITNILQELLERKEILYVSDAASTGGRRSKQYVLNPDCAHAGTVNCHRLSDGYLFDTGSCALDGRKYTGMRTVYEEGTAAQLKRETDRLRDADPLIRVIVISIPGFCEDGVVQVCDFHQLEGKNLQKELSVHVPAVVENDVNTACIGLYHEEKHENMALLYQPYTEYTGAGLIIRNRLYNGSGHRAGEMRYLYGEQSCEKVKKPAEQLWKEICAVQAVMDPELIGWCSDLVKEEDLKEYVEGSEVHLKQITDLDTLIEKGMYAIGRDYLMNHGKEENI